MKLIKSMALTTGVNSMQLSDIFTNNFRVYKIVVSGIVGQESTATGANVRLIKASDGSTESGSVYEYGLYSLKAEASYSDTETTNDTRWFNAFGGVDDSGRAAGGVLYISNPFQSSYTFATWQGTTYNNDNFRSYWGAGVIQNTTSYDGVTVDLNETASRIGGGDISVYGVL